jgi:hypothetical protein
MRAGVETRIKRLEGNSRGCLVVVTGRSDAAILALIEQGSAIELDMFVCIAQFADAMLPGPVSR